VLGLYVISIGTAFAQDGTFEGLPSPTALFNDALLFARVLPFVAALGIGFGVWQAKTSLRRTTPADATTVIRHDVGTVVAHWTNGVGFIVGIITGAMVLRWIQRPDDIRLLFFIHYVGASLVIFGIASHLAQHFVTGGMGLLPRSFREVREGLGEVIEYTGIFGPTGAAFRLNLPKGIRQPIAEILAAFGIKPPKRLGKYLPAEKVFSYLPWAVIITVIVFTGLVKAGRYLYPIPASFVAQMTMLHDLFTALAVVMLIVHLAAVTLAPRNWPLLKSMFTTRVPMEHIKTHHPVWYEKLRATRTSKEPAKLIGVEHPAEPTAAPTGE
jgi:cytochrome b subunit of formate dehydrogenase